MPWMNGYRMNSGLLCPEESVERFKLYNKGTIGVTQADTSGSCPSSRPASEMAGDSKTLHPTK